MAAGGAGDVSYGPLRHLGFGRFPAPRVDHWFEARFRRALAKQQGRE